MHIYKSTSLIMQEAVLSCSLLTVYPVSSLENPIFPFLSVPLLLFLSENGRACGMLINLTLLSCLPANHFDVSRVPSEQEEQSLAYQLIQGSWLTFLLSELSSWSFLVRSVLLPVVTTSRISIFSEALFIVGSVTTSSTMSFS